MMTSHIGPRPGTISPRMCGISVFLATDESIDKLTDSFYENAIQSKLVVASLHRVLEGIPSADDLIAFDGDKLALILEQIRKRAPIGCKFLLPRERIRR